MRKRTVKIIGIVVLLLGLLSWSIYKDDQRLRLSESLNKAVGRQDTAKVDTLLAQGAEPNLPGAANLSPLQMAPAPVPLIMPPVPPGKPQPPLESAIETGNLQTIRALLDHGADPNLRNRVGSTPFLTAITSGNMEVIRLLLDHGANVNGPMNGSYTALNEAIEDEKPYLIELLLDHGADIHRSNSCHMTPLINAVIHGEPETVSLLLRRGAGSDINLRACLGMTPLMYASQAGNTKIVQNLLNYGADVNEVSAKEGNNVIWTARSGGWTALMLAACGDHQEVVELLAAQGAKFNNVADDGNTALSWAALKGHPEMVAWLLAHRVDPHIKNKEGHTALDLVQIQKNRLLVYPKPGSHWSMSRPAWLYYRLSQSRSSPGWTPTDWIRFRAGQYDRTIRLLQHASQ